MILFNKV